MFKQFLLPIILLLFIVGYILISLMLAFIKKKNKVNVAYKKWKKHIIPSSNLKVIRADYYQEVEENYSPKAAFWSMAAGHVPSPKSELVILSYITYSEGNHTYQSQALKLDKSAVMYALTSKYSVDLYVKDKDIYQFDLDFLYQPS
jgi:hypothetical protein